MTKTGHTRPGGGATGVALSAGAAVLCWEVESCVFCAAAENAIRERAKDAMAIVLFIFASSSLL